MPRTKGKQPSEKSSQGVLHVKGTGLEAEVSVSSRRSSRHSGVTNDFLELDGSRSSRINPRGATNGKLSNPDRLPKPGRPSARVETHKSAQRQGHQIQVTEVHGTGTPVARAGRAGRRTAHRAEKVIASDERSSAAVEDSAKLPRKPRRAPHCSLCGLALSEHHAPCDFRQIEKAADIAADAAKERARVAAVQKSERSRPITTYDTRSSEDDAESPAPVPSDHYLDNNLDAMEEDDSSLVQNGTQNDAEELDVEMQDDFSAPVSADESVRDVAQEHGFRSQRFDNPETVTRRVFSSSAAGKDLLEHNLSGKSTHTGRPESNLAERPTSSRGVASPLPSQAQTQYSAPLSTPSRYTRDGNADEGESEAEADADADAEDDNSPGERGDADNVGVVTEERVRHLANALANGQVLSLAETNELRRSLEQRDGFSKPSVDLFLVAKETLHSRYHVKTYTRPLPGGIKATPNGAVELPLTCSSDRKIVKSTYADRKKHRHERFNAIAQKGDALAAAEEDEVWIFTFAVPKSGAGELREWTSPAVHADAPRLPGLIRKMIFDYLNPHREQAVREREAKEQTWQKELQQMQSQNQAAELRNAALHEQIATMQRDFARVQKRNERLEEKRRHKRDSRRAAKHAMLRAEEEEVVAAAAKKARSRASRNERRPEQ